MKTTFNRAIQFMVLPLLLVAAVVGCGKKNNNNNNVNNVGYGIQNGQCYQNGTSTIVQQSFCNGAGQYQFINGQCTVIGTNQAVDPALCQNINNGGYNGGYGGGYNGGYNGGYQGGYNGGYNGGYGGGYGYPTYPSAGYGGYSQTCYGQYYITNGFTSRIVSCNGYDCRGSFLYNYQTRLQVYCQ